MWNTYDFGTLIVPTAAIFFVTAAVSFRATGWFAAALAASLVKAGLFLFYFSMLFDDQYVLRDDQSYIAYGERIFARGIGLSNFWEHLPFLFTTAGGPHFAYYIHNSYAFHLFGHGYYAPVALNIILTTFMAYMGSRLAEREFGFYGPLGALFFYFFLVMPDVVAWSTIINDKDICVLFLHVVLLYGLSLWFQHRSVAALMLLIPASGILLFLRFYVPVLFGAAFMASILVAGRTGRKLYWLTAGTVLISLVVAVIGIQAIPQAVELVRNDLVNPAYGFLRFMLTPIPLNTETAYSFLDIPATVHWCLMPFAVFGVYKVYQLHTPFSRFFLLYFATFTAVYSLFAELQGPRHRVQLDFAWAVFQFAGMLALVNDARQARTKPSETLASAE